uniref:Uncharacterized protein n=1 Tax=Plectus sambesii TaxID=2011161 RepID=A0A914VCH9_9BILA
MTHAGHSAAAITCDRPLHTRSPPPPPSSPPPSSPPVASAAHLSAAIWPTVQSTTVRRRDFPNKFALVDSPVSWPDRAKDAALRIVLGRLGGAVYRRLRQRGRRRLAHAARRAEPPSFDLLLDRDIRSSKCCHKRLRLTKIAMRSRAELLIVIPEAKEPSLDQNQNDARFFRVLAESFFFFFDLFFFARVRQTLGPANSSSPSGLVHSSERRRERARSAGSQQLGPTEGAARLAAATAAAAAAVAAVGISTRHHSVDS